MLQNIKDNGFSWQQIPDHPYRILIVPCSGSVKTLVSVISRQPDIDDELSRYITKIISI